MTSGPDDQTRSVARATRVEIEKIKGSRFICDLAPISDAEGADEVVARVRASEPSATHHCWAYRLASGLERSSDDGEPTGTAGRPILQRLRSAGITDTVAIVTRYYGGVDLGTGGLIRAYGSAAGAAITSAETVLRIRMTDLHLTHRYDLSSAVEQVLAKFGAVVVDAEYTEVVALSVRVPASQSDEFIESLREATAGVVRARRVDDRPTDTPGMP